MQRGLYMCSITPYNLIIFQHLSAWSTMHMLPLRLAFNVSNGVFYIMGALISRHA